MQAAGIRAVDLPQAWQSMVARAPMRIEQQIPHCIQSNSGAFPLLKVIHWGAFGLQSSSNILSWPSFLRSQQRGPKFWELLWSRVDALEAIPKAQIFNLSWDDKGMRREKMALALGA